MKYFKAGFYGFLILNLVVILGMTMQTFIYWELRYSFVHEWSAMVRGLYTAYTILFVLGGIGFQARYER